MKALLILFPVYLFLQVSFSLANEEIIEDPYKLIESELILDQAVPIEKNNITNQIINNLPIETIPQTEEEKTASSANGESIDSISFNNLDTLFQELINSELIILQNIESKGVTSDQEVEIVEGVLENGGNWIKQGTPYHVFDVLIPKGQTLIIGPGTEIIMHGNLTVLGDLRILGASTSPVSFSSLDDEKWSIYIKEGGYMSAQDVTFSSMDTVFADRSRILLQNISIDNSIKGIELFQGSFMNGDNIHVISEMGTLSLFQGSAAKIENSTFHSINGYYAVAAYQNSNLEILHSKISTTGNVGVGIFGGKSNFVSISLGGEMIDGFQIFADFEKGSAAEVEIFETKIDGFSQNGFLINDSKVMLGNLSIKNGDQSLGVFNSELTMKGGEISYSKKGIFTLDSKIVCEGCSIHNTQTGIESYSQSGLSVLITSSSFVNNDIAIILGSYPESQLNFLIKNNWWGDETGPYFKDRNPLGMGNTIMTYDELSHRAILFDPWLLYSPISKRNPVVIIPGIMGSYLKKNDISNTEVWLNKLKLISLSDDFLDELSLNTTGLPDITSSVIIPTDIIREIGDLDFFDNLIKTLEKDGYQEGSDLFVYPYDWRLNIKDVVEDSHAPSLLSFKDFVDAIKRQTGSKKIDVIAHSMGGLVAKYYIANINAENFGKVITIGTPHLGSPKAAKVLLFGDNMGIQLKNFEKWINLNPLKIREISQNMPAVYQLLPSLAYFSVDSSEYENYLHDTNDFDENGIIGKLNYIETEKFLKNSNQNQFLLSAANHLHTLLDKIDLQDYVIDFYNIVGCGVPTIGKIFINKQQFETDYHYQLLYINGDGTVPMRSAEAWDTENVFYVSNVDHSVMSSDKNVSQLVSLILTNTTGNVDFKVGYNINSTSEYCDLPNGSYLSIHSPVEIHIYDDKGNHTGLDGAGNIEYEIPEVIYDSIEDNKFVFIPDKGKFSIQLESSGLGHMDVEIRNFQNGDFIDEGNFENIIVGSLNSKGEIVLKDKEYEVYFDQLGDGEKEKIEKKTVLKESGVLKGELYGFLDTEEFLINKKRDLIFNLDIPETPSVETNDHFIDNNKQNVTLLSMDFAIPEKLQNKNTNFNSAAVRTGGLFNEIVTSAKSLWSRLVILMQDFINWNLFLSYPQLIY